MSKKSKNIVLPALTTLLGRVPGVGRFLRNYSDTKAALEVANTTISSQATTIEQLAQDAIRLANDEDHWRRVATNAGTQYDVALSYLVTREANLRAKANKQTPQPVIITDLAMPPHVKLNRINHSSVNNSGAHWYVNKDGSLLDIVDPSQAKAFEAFLERVQVGLANCETHYAEEGQFLLLPLTRSSGISEITGRVKKPRNYVVKVTAYNVPPPELFRKLEDIAQEKRAQEGDTQNTGVPLARQTPSCIGVITIYDPKVTKWAKKRETTRAACRDRMRYAVRNAQSPGELLVTPSIARNTFLLNDFLTYILTHPATDYTITLQPDKRDFISNERLRSHLVDIVDTIRDISTEDTKIIFVTSPALAEYLPRNTTYRELDKKSTVKHAAEKLYFRLQGLRQNLRNSAKKAKPAYG